MQTPKTSSSGTPQKTSSLSQKKADSLETTTSQKISPRVVRQLNTGPRYSDHTASSAKLVAAKSPKGRSLKIADHRSPRSPASEEKKRVSELENQISQLENDLKIVKDQLCSTEELKKQAEKEAVEYNQQLLALSLKLQESQKQLSDQTASNSVLPEPSDEQDTTAKSELEDIHKHHSHESASLASVLNETKQLKAQLQIVAESEASNSKDLESEQSELRKLKENLSETLLLVEDMKSELRDCEGSETRAHILIDETLTQLDKAKKTVELLRSGGLKATEAYNAVASELEESRARVSLLEDLVSKLKADIITSEDSQMEISSLKLEVGHLRSALGSAEIRYNEERAQSAEEIQNALKMMEKIKSGSDQREAELESEIRRSKHEIEELKANLMDKETELQGICEENESLTVKLGSTLSGQRDIELEKMLNESKTEIENLKARIMDKETEWQSISEENEILKLEIKGSKVSDEISSDVELSRAAEREAVMKVNCMSKEVEKSNREAERVGEQLEAAQAAKAEMEAELRRLKVQTDQWRKAAEAAAAMISAGNNNHDNSGQVMTRTGSMDSHYSSPRTGKICSPYEDDLDDDILKKKNANMLRRFGVLWKKQHK
ncbi:hypothetical protein OROMI_011547 [Orobanche minor]